MLPPATLLMEFASCLDSGRTWVLQRWGMSYLRAGRSSSRPPRKAVERRSKRNVGLRLMHLTIAGFAGARNRGVPPLTGQTPVRARVLRWHNLHRHARRFGAAPYRAAGAPSASDDPGVAVGRGGSHRGRGLGPSSRTGRQLGPAELSLLQRMGLRPWPPGVGSRSSTAPEFPQPARRAAVLCDGQRRLAAPMDLVRVGA